MKLGNFIDEFIAKNSLVRLWKEIEDDICSHLMLTDGAVMEWEIMEIPELANLQVKNIRSIFCEQDNEAINIVIETDYSRENVIDLIKRFRHKRSLERKFVCESHNAT